MDRRSFFSLLGAVIVAPKALLGFCGRRKTKPVEPVLRIDGVGVQIHPLPATPRSWKSSAYPFYPPDAIELLRKAQ
ncbi:MAG: hypothetical protein V3V96_14390 [Acidiferrobacterales bacterium]